MTHRCHAVGCLVPVPPRMLMCGPHWRMVPENLQRAVLRHYRRGQVTDKRPSHEYLLAATDAIVAVFRAELEAAKVRQLRAAGPTQGDLFAALPAPRPARILGDPGDDPVDTKPDGP